MKKLQTLVVALGLAAGMTSADVWAANCTTTVHTFKHDDHLHYYGLTVCYEGSKLVGISFKHLGTNQIAPIAPTAAGVASAME